MLTTLNLGPRWVLRSPLAGAPEVATALESPSKSAPIEVISRHSLQEAAICPERVQDSGEVESTPLDWGELKSIVEGCRSCRLCEQRTQAVLGVGDRDADWLFVGEGPGAEEDQRGEPFVGQAGKLLDAMLVGLGIARGHGVYIANAVKCRPPNNRTPEPDEIEACFPYLQRQIELIRPRVIVALGRPAAQALLKQEIRIGAARGQVFRFGEIPVVVTYHPAYLLRNPADKGKAWADLCFARKTLASSPPKVKETA
ncbi:uracil-DNA glycosylase family protein [Niveibacterium sp. COAC-50]|uniref:uracil-DNA glycosylase n=1 Tax=Niveibacterium sp. COAC-50 TaxID=2729384 RepID=UPI0035303171